MKINLQTLNAFSKFNVRKVNNNLNFMSSFVSSPLKADSFERTTPSLSVISFEGRSRNNKQVNKNGEVREATDFAVKNIHNIECPACEKITMDQKDIDEYVSKVATKRGQELVDALDTYGDEYYWTADPSSKGKTIYRENIEGILEVVKRLALENPDADLKGIVKIAASDAMPDLVGKQLNVLGEIDAYTLNNFKNKSEREAIFKVADKHRNLILDRVPEKHFKRKTFISDLARVYVENDDKKKELLEIAKKLPASTDDSSSFFVKYAYDSKRGIKEIASRFVIENRPTGEHINCFSDGGASDKDNYICDCAYCNSKRGDTSFKIWARTIPNFQENLQKYLDTVQQNIDNYNLPNNYKGYPQKIIKVIDAQSDGEIKLMDPYEFRKQRNEEFAKRAQEKLEAKKAELERLADEMAYVKEQMAESYSKAARLRTQLNKAETKDEKQRLKEEIKKEEARQAELSNLKKEFKNEFWALKKSIE